MGNNAIFTQPNGELLEGSNPAAATALVMLFLRLTVMVFHGITRCSVVFWVAQSALS